ncbi:MAG: ATPase [Christensenellales bacterium]|jgi:cell division septum initiation protein DivIVA
MSSIFELIDELENEIEKSSTIPLTGKKMIDKEIVFDIIKDIKENLPDQIEQAKAIIREKQRILDEVKKEADSAYITVEESKQKALSEHEITRQANEQANKIIAAAQKNAFEIRTGAQTYADDILQDVQRYIEEYMTIIKANRKELMGLSNNQTDE